MLSKLDKFRIQVSENTLLLLANGLTSQLLLLELHTLSLILTNLYLLYGTRSILLNPLSQTTGYLLPLWQIFYTTI